MNTTTTANATILYVDDDSDDCLFLRSSWEEAGNTAKLVCTSSGEEAVAYLNSIDPSSLPRLIVLDLNMPRWDGRRTLLYLKSQPHLAAIPVIVFSTSESKQDIEACVQLGAASYLKKPFHYDGYKNIIADFNRYLRAS
ncbi:MAG: response regulator [Chitinophagaceae bacterium]|jgi:CheY-like chemotaxis protein|nr:MAG: response regulator [Chitinophagaceae bacterium]